MFPYPVEQFRGQRLMIGFWGRAHSENFPKNEFYSFVKLPGEVVCIRVFFGGVKLVERGDHRVKIRKSLSRGSRFILIREIFH